MLGFCFLSSFESVAWVVLIACIIPWVDAYSVFFGPTKTITEKHGHVFTTLVRVPGAGRERGRANLGLPDLLFFAVFLAAAARFRLRVYWTWLALVLSFGRRWRSRSWTDQERPAGVAATGDRVPGRERGSALAAAAVGKARGGTAGEVRARPVSVALRASDLGATARFYRESLGVPLEPAGAARSTSGGSSCQAMTALAWRSWSSRARPARSRSGCRWRSRWDDLHGAHHRAVATGAAILHGPRDEPTGLTARYADPDGNVVALVQS
jgi:predicted enzyme related to lactoylglutathione lyase